MEKRIQIGIKLPPSTIARVDQIRESFPVLTTRTACFEKAIEEWCLKWEKEEAKRSKRK